MPLASEPRAENADTAEQPSVVDVGRPSEESALGQESGAKVGISSDVPVRHGDFAPQTVWYVQATEGDKAGERFGPASGDLMQAWIAEGRVLPNYLVWRDGWSDWQPGSNILARAASCSDAVSTGLTGPIAAAVPVIEETSVDRSIASRSTRSSWKPALVILLVLAGLVLAVGAGLAKMTGQI